MESADEVDVVETDLVHATGSSLRPVFRQVLVAVRPLVA
jgi:hypothetical protein